MLHMIRESVLCRHILRCVLQKASASPQNNLYGSQLNGEYTGGVWYYILAPSGREGEFTQPRTHNLAGYCIFSLPLSLRIPSSSRIVRLSLQLFYCGGLASIFEHVQHVIGRGRKAAAI